MKIFEEITRKMTLCMFIYVRCNCALSVVRFLINNKAALEHKISLYPADSTAVVLTGTILMAKGKRKVTGSKVKAIESKDFYCSVL